MLLPLGEKKQVHCLTLNCQESPSAIFFLLFGNKIGKEPHYLELSALSGVNVNKTQHIYGFISRRGSQTEGNLR